MVYLAFEGGTFYQLIKGKLLPSVFKNTLNFKKDQIYRYKFSRQEGEKFEIWKVTKAAGWIME